jgi:hypothetical protein
VLGAFQHRFLAIACKHEVGDAPNVDFLDHGGEVIRRPYIDGLTCRFPAFSRRPLQCATGRRQLSGSERSVVALIARLGEYLNQRQGPDHPADHPEHHGLLDPPPPTSGSRSLMPKPSSQPTYVSRSIARCPTDQVKIRGHPFPTQGEGRNARVSCDNHWSDHFGSHGHSGGPGAEQ